MFLFGKKEVERVLGASARSLTFEPPKYRKVRCTSIFGLWAICYAGYTHAHTPTARAHACTFFSRKRTWRKRKRALAARRGSSLPHNSALCFRKNDECYAHMRAYSCVFAQKDLILTCVQRNSVQESAKEMHFGLRIRRSRAYLCCGTGIIQRR